MPDHLVVFTPSGKRGRFAAGTPLLNAARSLAVDLDSVCGGRGICGRCQVEIATGEFPKHGIASGNAHVSTRNAVEDRYDAVRGLAGRRRLGCQAQVQGDLAVDVPAESQVHRQVVRKRAEAHPITVDPTVRLYFVEVAEPDMHDPSSDFGRLAAALADRGAASLTANTAVLRTLQGTLRKGLWQVTAAVRQDGRLVRLWPGYHDRALGLAVDIGSTTIAAHLCDLATGEVVASAGRMNPQIRFGEDLMSRVSHVMLHPGGDVELTEAVRGAVREIMAEADRGGRGYAGGHPGHHRGRKPGDASPFPGSRPDGTRRGAVRTRDRCGARRRGRRSRSQGRAGSTGLRPALHRRACRRRRRRHGA